ncbi:MAG TPA: DUF4199 domain-containing protein [Gemmatimonadales bacterium]|nr:DUF4199 domain-containing protein [Gemmatimonadales bacterium]
MRRYVLTYGLIAGAILSVLMVISMSIHDRIGFDRAMIVGYTTMVIAFLMIFFGVKAYRDNEHPDGLTFGRAFATGLLISFVATACYVATWQVVSRTMATDYLEKYAAYTLEKSREAGASEAELAAEAKEMAEFQEMYRNPLVNIAFTFVEPLPVGLLMSLVAAGVLRRKAVG